MNEMTSRIIVAVPNHFCWSYKHNFNLAGNGNKGVTERGNVPFLRGLKPCNS
jgi:hypothetical protein